MCYSKILNLARVVGDHFQIRCNLPEHAREPRRVQRAKSELYQNLQNPF